jgi:hypothetical protein
MMFVETLPPNYIIFAHQVSALCRFLLLSSGKYSLGLEGTVTSPSAEGNTRYVPMMFKGFFGFHGGFCRKS